MKLLELFSGTQSVGKVARSLGYEVISVDISNEFKQPTHLIDILLWDYTEYPKDTFDIVWASPPCHTFSKMTFLTKTKEEAKIDELKFGVPLLQKACEIINYFNPKFYFLENPATGRMHTYIESKPKRVSYCQYGFLYRKDTHIWTNKEFIPKRCNKKNCPWYGSHPLKIGTTRKGIDKNSLTKKEQKFKIPERLIKDLLE